MKILQVNPDFEPYVKGGGVLVFKTFADTLNVMGHDVTILSSRPWSRHNQESNMSTENVHFFDLLPSTWPLREAAYYLPLTVRSTLNLRRWLDKNLSGFDLIIVHGFMEGLCRRVLTRGRSRPNQRIIVVHYGIAEAKHSQTMRPTSHIIYKLLGEKLLKNTESILAFTKRTALQIKDLYSVDIWNKVRLEEIPLNLEPFVTALHSYRANRHEFELKLREEYNVRNRYMFSIGRNVKVKGFDILIKSLVRLLKTTESASDLDVYIAGDITPYTRALEHEARILGINERVHFVGRISEEMKVAFMMNSEAFVIPSITEGYGINAVEAQMIGIRTIATSTGAHTEILGGLEDSIIIDPGDVEQLTNAMRVIISRENKIRASMEDQELKTMSRHNPFRVLRRII